MSLKQRYDSLNAEIRKAGLTPVLCPECGNKTLWPKTHDVRNARSRRAIRVSICSPCGVMEAGEPRR